MPAFRIKMSTVFDSQIFRCFKCTLVFLFQGKASIPGGLQGYQIVEYINWLKPTHFTGFNTK